jgi:hypothetical protein
MHLKPGALIGASPLERGLMLGVLASLALLAFGAALAPSTFPIALAPAAVLVVYAVIVHVGVDAVRRGHPKIVLVTTMCGLLGALVLVPSILIEYFGRTVNNAYAFGAAFVLWFSAGVMAARLSRRIRDAVLSSTLSAMMSSLFNIAAVLASFYLLRGSALQDRFFRTEGDYEDFARSGEKDFNTWIVGDLFGGAFFHFLLGALIGAALGCLAGVVTVSLVRRTNDSRRSMAATRLTE